MIVITGGAGMIGSMIGWHLNHAFKRRDLVLVDRLHHAEQWQNLCHRRYANYLDKDELLPWLQGLSKAEASKIEAVIHMGAISATTERDFNKLVQDNIRYSQSLWQWCTVRQVPFLYASSAATYGNGTQGYDDDQSQMDSLRPLNGYGYSKLFFDQWAWHQVQLGNQPPQWCGFKFFNVYGPNEYHKERMASVVFHSFNQFRETGTVRLFKSHLPDYADGMQLRDFVYVKDAATVVCHFLQHRQYSGIFNVGCGEARAFMDLATAVMRSQGSEPSITFVDMPNDLHGKYQYYTQANIAKLRDCGYQQAFYSLEAGVADYVQEYLLQDDPYC